MPLLTSFLFRQGILSLEDCWPTKNPWFRLITTLIGMSVVDLHRWDRNKRSGGSAFDWMSSDDERPQFLQVRSMSNLVGRGLRKPEMRYYSQNNPRQPIQQRACLGGQPQVLTRITNASGETARPSNGKNNGKGYVMACFICRQYQQRQTNTNWWCSACKMHYATSKGGISSAIKSTWIIVTILCWGATQDSILFCLGSTESMQWVLARAMTIISPTMIPKAIRVVVTAVKVYLQRGQHQQGIQGVH